MILNRNARRKLILARNVNRKKKKITGKDNYVGKGEILKYKIATV